MPDEGIGTYAGSKRSGCRFGIPGIRADIIGGRKMLTEKIDINAEGSLPGAALYTYIIDSSPEIRHNERPLVLICPGGGYEFTSDREAEYLALQFLAMGYHAAVLRYSITPAVFPTALCELAMAMKTIKERAAEWNVISDKIFVLGCSAGGHLAASLGVFWNDEELKIADRIGTVPEMLRPAGLILCYPVITSGEYAHRGSFDFLLKGICTDELMAKVSLEDQVTADTPPVFIWHTFTDDCVPVENSLMFVNALKKAGVNTEFHMYPVGGHGLSTAKEITLSPNWNEVVPECQSWLPLLEIWLKGQSRD